MAELWMQIQDKKKMKKKRVNNIATTMCPLPIGDKQNFFSFFLKHKQSKNFWSFWDIFGQKFLTVVGGPAQKRVGESEKKTFFL